MLCLRAQPRSPALFTGKRAFVSAQKDADGHLVFLFFKFSEKFRYTGKTFCSRENFFAKIGRKLFVGLVDGDALPAREIEQSFLPALPAGLCPWLNGAFLQ